MSRYRPSQAHLGRDVATGMPSINRHGLSLTELPSGGIKHSASGPEGDVEAMDNDVTTMFVTRVV